MSINDNYHVIFGVFRRFPEEFEVKRTPEVLILLSNIKNVTMVTLVQ